MKSAISQQSISEECPLQCLMSGGNNKQGIAYLGQSLLFVNKKRMGGLYMLNWGK
ncbi:hypothetical protein AM1BK_11350 [Neobacillus kokaensis]|uniref:Uncharacterized protein n=1 Tax=Neobacillus kokaensis TaxID=2759023 RepID=A0ABQ3MYU0_9BACI|nr:hypothetical protein AM1BK_11350 [Neobacillus kokaensis]